MQNGVVNGQSIGNLSYSSSLSDLPSLQYVCVDEEEWSNVQSVLYNNYGTQCYVTTDCIFMENDIYSIEGNVRFDEENEGCSPENVSFSYLNIEITNETNNYNYILNFNQTGDYGVNLLDGENILTPYLSENPTYFDVSPSTVTVDFPEQESPFEQDFCVTAVGIHSNVEILFAPSGVARPGFDAYYDLIFRNIGNQVENGAVTLTYNNDVLNFLSSTVVEDAQTDNSFTWNFNNLQPFEKRKIRIGFSVNSPMDTPPVNINDILVFTAQITIDNTDENLDNNEFILNQVVVGAYDPNDIICLQGESINTAEVGEYLHYRIRFENTGNYPATNIVVVDTLDSDRYDISTLVTLDASHDLVTRVKGDRVEFIFDDINLDFNEGSNGGYVIFKVKTLPTLGHGDQIADKADIFFDYNPPITTNTYVTTVISELGLKQLKGNDNDVILYPNPTENILHIQTKNIIKSIEVFNLQGIKVLSSTKAEINVSELEGGTYIVRANTNKGVASRMFVKK